jgi:hypothetical protein
MRVAKRRELLELEDAAFYEATLGVEMRDRAGVCGRAALLGMRSSACSPEMATQNLGRRTLTPNTARRLSENISTPVIIFVTLTI